MQSITAKAMVVKMREPIIASEGHVLTNGRVYGKMIYLAEGMDAAEFYEITEDEYAVVMEAEVAE